MKDQVKAQEYKDKYNKINIEIDRLIGQWDYANILLGSPLVRDNLELMQSIFADINTFKEQIKYKQKLRDDFHEKYLYYLYGE